MKKKINSTSLDEVLDRVSVVSNSKNDAALGRALDVSRQTVSTWRKRGTIPYEKICGFAEKQEISLDYLLFGNSEPISEQGVNPQLFMLIGAYLEVEWSKSDLRNLTRGERYYYTSLLYNRILGIPSAPSNEECLSEEVRAKTHEEIQYIITLMSDANTDPAHPYQGQE